MQAQLFGKLVLWIQHPPKDAVAAGAVLEGALKPHDWQLTGMESWLRSVQQDVLYFAVQEIWIDKTEWNEKVKATSDKHFHIGDIILLQITYSMRCVIASAESLFFTKCNWNQNYHHLVHKYILKLSTPYKPILLASGRYLLGATVVLCFVEHWHQQNRKVPTLKGRQYKVLQLLGSKPEQYKLDANLGASLYSRSRW